MISSVLETAHFIIGNVLEEGAWAVDATVGNGHDTLWLAECVGASGKVVGFDIQEAAIKTTRQRLASAQMLERVILIQKGHEKMGQEMPSEMLGRVRAVMFNLGYLPHGDKGIITQSHTTLKALEQASDLLDVGGIIAIVAYTGHPGGCEEIDCVRNWLSKMERNTWRDTFFESISQRNSPPCLITLERMSNTPKP